MGKETRTVEKEVWVCDHCLAESDYKNLSICGSCGQEICPQCQTSYHFRAERRKPGKATWGVIMITGHYEGLRAAFCEPCTRKLESQLRELGFESFQYDVEAV